MRNMSIIYLGQSAPSTTGGSGASGSGAIAVPDDQFFTDEAERDSFFGNNPSELSEGVYCVVGEQLQQYKNGTWKDITPIVRGPKGEQGATGPANTLTIGTVISGDMASATITGDAPNQVLNLVLPQGPVGPGLIKGGLPGQILAKASENDYDLTWIDSAQTGGGTSDYNQLTNKPQINSVELSGNKTLEELGIQPAGDYALAADMIAGKIEYVNGDILNVQEALDSLLYVAPTVKSLTGGGTYELGQIIDSVTLNWSLNKEVTSQSFNQNIGFVNSSLRSLELVELGLVSDTAYTLTVSDGKKSASKTTSVVFRQKRYWGVSAKDTLTNEEVLALS